MENAPALISAAAALLFLGFGWLVATWIAADDQPIFAPFAEGRVTFKMVLQDALRDLVQITRPVWKWVVINAPVCAVAALDVIAVLTPALRDALFGSVAGAMAILALNIVARIAGLPSQVR